MDERRLAQEFKSFGPWVTQFSYKKNFYGGKYAAANDPRVMSFYNEVSNPLRILEVGCLEGGHSLALSRLFPDSKILSIDSRFLNLKKCSFIKDVFELENVSFLRKNLEQDTLTDLGNFDTIFSIGFLYLLENPLFFLRECAAVSSHLFLWTHVSRESDATISYEGFNGMWYEEHDIQNFLSGMSSRSFWPTFESLKKMLQLVGFDDITILQHDLSHVDGPVVMLSANKS